LSNLCKSENRFAYNEVFEPILQDPAAGSGIPLPILQDPAAGSRIPLLILQDPAAGSRIARPILQDYDFLNV